MRSITAAILLGCTILSSPASGQTFSPERIKSDVTFLSDDLLEGRGNGSRGYEIAARFVAQRFTALGLQPANAGSWYQRVPFSESALRPGTPALVRIGSKTFANGSEVLLSATPYAADQKITADAVFVGYGLDAPAQGLDDYAGLDVRGKIVVALWGFPPGVPSEMAAHLSSEKARMAQDRGAAGLLIIHTPAYEKVYPWAERLKALPRPSHNWIGADGRPYSIAPDLAITGALSQASAAALFVGAPRTLSSVLQESARPGARVKGFALKPRVSVERHSVVTKISSPNVMAVLPGSDPRLANEYVVLTGHLDAIGLVDPVDGDPIVNGAMDNASGIATMLEAARAFVESGKRPRRSIMFVALAGEEKGLLGASYLANNPVTGNGQIVGLVNLDMPILTYDFKDVIAFGAEHSTIGSAVAKAIAGDGLSVSPDPEPQQVLFTRSDHYMFVKKGVPAVSLDTGDANGGQAATAEFRKLRYHQPGDDVSQAFNWRAAAKFARVNYLIARELADAAEPPRWYAGDFFGDTFAKGQPKAKR